MDYLASMYIDNELDLEEKISFIEKIESEEEFFKQTVELLVQEKLLQTMPELKSVPAELPTGPDFHAILKKIFRPIVYAGAGFAAAGLLLFTQMTTSPGQVCNNRFVIFEPAANQVELAGSFTGWQKKPMKQIGTTGYWELTLRVPTGEHRFSYILDGSRKMADPTLPVREKDDFGGENSILKVEERV